jgi:hypothetical protein
MGTGKAEERKANILCVQIHLEYRSSWASKNTKNSKQTTKIQTVRDVKY